MNRPQGNCNSKRNDHLYTINLQLRDRIMAEAYLARSQYLGKVLRKAAQAVVKLATALTEKSHHGAVSTH